MRAGRFGLTLMLQPASPDPLFPHPEIHRHPALPVILPLADSAPVAIYVNVLLVSAVPEKANSTTEWRCLMDEVEVLALSDELDRLHPEHSRYAQRLEELLQKPYLTEDEQLEEVRLKKLKLHAKDLIYAIERRLPAVA